MVIEHIGWHQGRAVVSLPFDDDDITAFHATSEFRALLRQSEGGFLLDLRRHSKLTRVVLRWVLDANRYCMELAKKPLTVVSASAQRCAEREDSAWHQLECLADLPDLDNDEPFPVADDHGTGAWMVVRLPRLLVGSQPLPPLVTDLVIDAGRVRQAEGPGLSWLARLLLEHRARGFTCRVQGARGVVQRLINRLPSLMNRPVQEEPLTTVTRRVASEVA